MNRCFAIALSILTLTCGALAEPISVTEISGVDGDTIDAHGQHRLEDLTSRSMPVISICPVTVASCTAVPLRVLTLKIGVNHRS
jgi:hypothetical protein